jgi:hypothetical protein
MVVSHTSKEVGVTEKITPSIVAEWVQTAASNGENLVSKAI